MKRHSISEPGKVQSVGRALSILEIIASSPRPLSTAEISRILSLPKATVHRLIGTLVAYGYVRHDEHLYSRGPALATLRKA